MDIVTINVAGKHYQMTTETLLKIPYFANMMEDCQNKDINNIFVNRSSMMFDHVLAFVIDPLHPYPLKYRYELDFYGILYDVNKLERQQDIDTQLMALATRVDMLSTNVDTMTDLIKRIDCVVNSKHSKNIKCKQCHMKYFSVNNNIICNECVKKNLCCYHDCYNPALQTNDNLWTNYCKQHFKTGPLCVVRNCSYLKYNKSNVCYIHHK